MKKTGLVFLLLTYTCILFAQGEASHWYFGNGAGIVFDITTGNATAVDSAVNTIATTEGCSSISDANGNLLFYTDGRTVWDANYQIMPNANYANGTGLLGDPSSTSSGLIVPKPNNPNQYYIFTVDEPHHNNAWAIPPNPGPADQDGNPLSSYQETTNIPGSVPADDDGFNNGLNYSLVDLTLNNGLGDIVATEKNVHLITYDENDPTEVAYKCAEKITAVAHADGNSYWLITQFKDRFFSFLIQDTGVNPTPVITQIAPNITTEGYRRNAIGYLKASPDGTKLAICHNQNINLPSVTDSSPTSGGVWLYDFNPNTGEVTNPLNILSNVAAYGIDFSADSKKLYATHNGDISQFNLEAADIPNSQVILNASSNTLMGAVQLAPDGRLYICNLSTNPSTLDVINNPEEVGMACNYVAGGITLASGTAGRLGLPPFIQSFLIARIQYTNTCLGDDTAFSVNSSDTINAITWNFGDGTTSNNLNPTHNYNAADTYTVSTTITTDSEVKTFTRSIVISTVPVANTPSNIDRCDTNQNGTDTFDFSNKTSEALLNQDPNLYSVHYFESLENAENFENEITFPYTNLSNPQTIYTRVENNTNVSCYDISTFEITLHSIPEIIQLNNVEFCDNLDNTSDGIGTANLDELIPLIRGIQLQTNVTFHLTQEDADDNLAALPLTYTTASDEIFVRIENSNNTDCYSTGSFQLIINPKPIANDVSLIQCDEDGIPEGFTTFNLNEAFDAITDNNPDASIRFYLSQIDSENDENAISADAFENFFNPQIIYTRVTNTNTDCVNFGTLSLEVSVTSSNNASISVCDDDGIEDGFASFNLNNTDAIVLAGAPAGLPVTYYETYLDALLETNALSTTFTNTIPYNQTIYARVENSNACYGISEIELTVFELPNIETEFETLYCLKTFPETIVLNAGIINDLPNNYLFNWSTGENTATIEVNTPGTYTVNVSNTNGCSKTRTITVLPSNTATITNIEVTDASEHNSISVFVTGEGDYEYALDDSNGPYQDANIFENVLPGLYTIFVRDKNNCGIVDELVSVIGFPKFFTPNNDTENDFWQVKGISRQFQPNTLILIFDRYGKLLKELDPLSRGWDGTYNGAKMPTSDYWFKVQLEDGRTFTSHFTLKR